MAPVQATGWILLMGSSVVFAVPIAIVTAIFTGAVGHVYGLWLAPCVAALVIGFILDQVGHLFAAEFEAMGRSAIHMLAPAIAVIVLVGVASIVPSNLAKVLNVGAGVGLIVIGLWLPGRIVIHVRLFARRLRSRARGV